VIGVPAWSTPTAYHSPYGQEEPTHAISTAIGGSPLLPRQPAGAYPGAGTVYGGQTGQLTSANADAPIDTSGSLTGLILSRGMPLHAPVERRTSRLKAVLIGIVAALAAIGFVGVVVYVLAGDFLLAIYRTLVGH
jgi:hypothetical protein